MGDHQQSIQSRSAPESNSAPPEHQRPYWKRAHRDWRFWVAVVIMLAAMIVYVSSQNLSWRPHFGHPLTYGNHRLQKPGEIRGWVQLESVRIYSEQRLPARSCICPAIREKVDKADIKSTATQNQRTLGWS